MEQRSYGKQELAMLYFPSATPDAALKRLYRWINRIPQLREELRAANTSKNAKYWTRQQVRSIVYYLDEP